MAINSETSKKEILHKIGLKHLELNVPQHSNLHTSKQLKLYANAIADSCLRDIVNEVNVNEYNCFVSCVLQRRNKSRPETQVEFIYANTCTNDENSDAFCILKRKSSHIDALLHIYLFSTRI
ncbi:hypothetical protein GJ496_007106 [Pomphorhynchus laevis]|nr:hypothetical protein GJ496_007106 [Pomphorhynchus laevis]